MKCEFLSDCNTEMYSGVVQVLAIEEDTLGETG